MSVENLNDVQDMRPRLRSRIIPMNQDVLTTFDMGWLIPHRAESLVPGDKVNIGHSAFFRFDPFLNPILSRANCKNYDFMIPERILYDEREYDKWFTGGVNDKDHDKLKPHLSFNVFYKFCYDFFGDHASLNGNDSGGLFGFNSLCDYLGLPVNQLYIPTVYNPSTGEVQTPGYWMAPNSVTNTTPILLERFLAYALVYREYFLWNHDENSVWVTNKYLDDFTKIPFGNLDDLLDSEDSAYDEEFVEFLGVILSLKRKGWNHDYFTSALPNIQSGDPASLTLGSGSIFKAGLNVNTNLGNNNNYQDSTIKGDIIDTATGKRIFQPLYWLEEYRQNGGSPELASGSNTGRIVVVDGTQPTAGQAFDNRVNYQPLDAQNMWFQHSHNWQLSKDQLNAITNSNVSSFTVNDLRLLNAIQVYKERLNIGGTRLKEALYMQFGVTVPDDRLDRPDFVGYMDFPVQISEVLQTSQSTSDSVLGDQGGHGISANSQQTVFNYFVLEPMVHLSIMAVLPDTYYAQGLDSFWSKVSRYDIWNPVFNHLSDQALYKDEIYFNPARIGSDTEFGYLPRFAEYKATYNRVTGNLRKYDSGMMSWHQARFFGSSPSLSQNFIDAKPSDRVFAVVEEDKESSEGAYPTQLTTHVIGVIQNEMKLSRNVPSGSDPSLNID